MKIAEIVETEKDNYRNLYLHKEGIFWRAYEKSAFQLQQAETNFRVLKKSIKSLKSEIVYSGFPENTLDKILAVFKNKTIEKQEKLLKISDLENCENDFIVWKDSISRTENKTEIKEIPILQESRNNQKVISQINNFQVITKSPLECQQFLIQIQIQNQINGNI